MAKNLKELNAQLTALLNDDLKGGGGGSITKTSQLENDGDGTSPFATEAYVEEHAGEENVIETVKVNGVALVPDSQKAVNVEAQAPLVSGRNIKNINGNRLLGSGNLDISKIVIPSETPVNIATQLREAITYGIPIHFFTNEGTGEGMIYPVAGFASGGKYRCFYIDLSEDAKSLRALEYRFGQTGAATLHSYNKSFAQPVITQGNWKYRVNADDTFEAWCKQTGYTVAITDKTGVLYKSPLKSLELPTELTDAYNCEVIHASVNCGHNNYVTWAELASTYATGINFNALSGDSRVSNPNYTLTAYIFGAVTPK